MRQKTLGTLALLCIVLHAPATAMAQPSKAASDKADKLFREGRDAMKRRDHQLACQKFAESQELDPAPGTLINISECEEALGRASLAYRHIREALPGLPDGDPRVPLAKSRLESLERRVGRLTVRLGGDAADPTTKLLLDGIEVGANERTQGLVLDPGKHVLLARTADGREEKRSLDIGAGRSHDVELSIAPQAKKSVDEPAERPATPPPATHTTSTEDPGQTQRVIGYAVGAVGIIGLGFGFYSALASSSTSRESKSICPTNENCSLDDVTRHEALKVQASNERTRAIVGFALGAVGIGAGLALVLTAPSKQEVARLQVAPVVGAGMMGVGASGRW